MLFELVLHATYNGSVDISIEQILQTTVAEEQICTPLAQQQ